MHNFLFQTLKEPCRFYFLRHGESEGNRLKQLQGRQESPLTANGQSQAHRAGRYLTNIGIRKVHSSPQSRAIETAKIIADSFGINHNEIERNEDLMEIDTGIFSGLSLKGACERHPEIWKEFNIHSWEVVPGAERIHQLVKRATRVWQELIQSANSGHTNLLTVSHGGLLQWIIKSSMAAEWISWFPIIRSDNCCIHLMEIIPRDTLGEGCYAEWKMLNHPPEEQFSNDE